MEQLADVGRSDPELNKLNYHATFLERADESVQWQQCTGLSSHAQLPEHVPGIYCLT